MTANDATIDRLHRARRALEEAAELTGSVGIDPSIVDSVRESLAKVREAIDCATRDAFSKGTTRPIQVRKPVRLGKKRPTEPDSLEPG